jgi:hypothetical protein
MHSYKGRADVGKVGPTSLRCQHGTAAGDQSARCQRAVKPLADFLHQGKRAFDTGVATRPSGHGNQAIGTLLYCLVRIPVARQAAR